MQWSYKPMREYATIFLGSNAGGVEARSEDWIHRPVGRAINRRTVQAPISVGSPTMTRTQQFGQKS